jgi:hypothetical protein
MTITPEQAAALAAPFDPADVDFRPLEGNQVAAYVDARVVSARLNDVLGTTGWEWDWLPLVVTPGVPRKRGGDPPPHDVVWLVKGTITIGGVSKSDIGEGDANETSKAAVSDALKRTAVLFGVGAYLYSLPRQTARVENFQIPPEELKRLRAGLPRPKQPVGRAVVAQETQQRSEAATDTPARINAADQDAIRRAVNALGWGKVDADQYLRQYGVARFGELTPEQAAEVIPDLLSKAAEIDAA